MALTIKSHSSNTATSGAGLGAVTDQNMLTLAGVAAGAVTGGGALFVATAVAPGHVIGGTIITSALIASGHLKNTTGSYLPFLGNKKDETPTTVTAVSAA